MTKKLEDLLNLPESQEIIETTKTKKKSSSTSSSKITMHEIEDIDKITAALPQVKGLGELGDTELDEVSEKSMAAYDDLMDLGMNVEPRFSAPIFDAASRLLGHAITAKTSKIDKKLKALDLDIKRRRLEMQEKQAKLADEEESGVAQELDRNALLEMLRNKDSDK